MTPDETPRMMQDKTKDRFRTAFNLLLSLSCVIRGVSSGVIRVPFFLDSLA